MGAFYSLMFAILRCLLVLAAMVFIFQIYSFAIRVYYSGCRIHTVPMTMVNDGTKIAHCNCLG
jgi:hypothetical protein